MATDIQSHGLLAALDRMNRSNLARRQLMARLGGKLGDSPERIAAMPNAGPMGTALLRHILEGQPADDETIHELANQVGG